jgi:hypothetical protein
MPLRFVSFLMRHAEQGRIPIAQGSTGTPAHAAYRAALSAYTGYTCTARPWVYSGRPGGRHLAAAAGAPCCAAASAANRPRSVRRMFSTIGRSVPASGASASGTS